LLHAAFSLSDRYGWLLRYQPVNNAEGLSSDQTIRSTYMEQHSISRLQTGQNLKIKMNLKLFRYYFHVDA